MPHQHQPCATCGEYHVGDCPEELLMQQRDGFDEWLTDRCDWCGNLHCTCDDVLFDADELGLDPEDDQWPRR